MTKPTKPRKARRKPLNVDAVIAMVEFRDHMRQQAEARRQFERANAAWWRITAKLVTLVIVLGFSAVVIAHAMASH
jgi:hypothetical protein